MLFFHRADGDAETVGDFLVGEQFDLAEQQDGAAALGGVGHGVANGGRRLVLTRRGRLLADAVVRSLAG